MDIPATRSPLGIVIPTLNEEEALGRLLSDLASQRGVELTLVVADGGSTDRTRFVFERFAPSLPFRAEWVEAPRGRGRQMNAGARELFTFDLLFLHADSRLPDPDTLAVGVKALEEARARAGHARVAGHFGLLFDAPKKDGFYYFYEAKTFTNRAGTVNGDQGLLLSREFFASLGGFNVTLPYLEDTRIERRIRERGLMVALPGAVVTSARRFNAEGRAGRQVVNALLRGFEAAGRTEFLGEVARVYRAQGETVRLRLLPFFLAAHKATVGRGFGGWAALWYEVGRFVRSNAWQLPFMCDCLIGRLSRVRAGEGKARLTRAFSPVFDLLTDNPVGRLAAALLTGAAFYGVMCALLLFGKEAEK